VSPLGDLRQVGGAGVSHVDAALLPAAMEAEMPVPSGSAPARARQQERNTKTVKHSHAAIHPSLPYPKSTAECELFADCLAKAREHFLEGTTQFLQAASTAFNKVYYTQVAVQAQVRGESTQREPSAMRWGHISGTMSPDAIRGAMVRFNKKELRAYSTPGIPFTDADDAEALPLMLLDRDNTSPLPSARTSVPPLATAASRQPPPSASMTPLLPPPPLRPLQTWPAPLPSYLPPQVMHAPTNSSYGSAPALATAGQPMFFSSGYLGAPALGTAGHPMPAFACSPHAPLTPVPGWQYGPPGQAPPYMAPPFAYAGAAPPPQQQLPFAFAAAASPPQLSASRVSAPLAYAAAAPYVLGHAAAAGTNSGRATASDPADPTMAHLQSQQPKSKPKRKRGATIEAGEVLRCAMADELSYDRTTAWASILSAYTCSVISDRDERKEKRCRASGIIQNRRQQIRDWFVSNDIGDRGISATGTLVD
jgi:hypothetical protein